MTATTRRVARTAATASAARPPPLDGGLRPGAPEPAGTARRRPPARRGGPGAAAAGHAGCSTAGGSAGGGGAAEAAGCGGAAGAGRNGLGRRRGWAAAGRLLGRRGGVDRLGASRLVGARGVSVAWPSPHHRHPRAAGCRGRPDSHANSQGGRRLAPARRHRAGGPGPRPAPPQPPVRALTTRDGEGRPRWPAIHAEVSTSASRSMPVSTPAPSRSQTRSSVARLPVADFA